VCLVLPVLTIAAGALGVPLSFLFLASGSMADINAGTSGCVAGSVLLGSALIALAILAAGGHTSSPVRPEMTEG
jgi:hypothetical protein